MMFHKINRINRVYFYFILFSILFTSVMFVPAYARTTTYFSPKTNLQNIDIHWLNKSLKVKRLYIAMYSFTDYKIAKDLLYLAHKGVKIYLYRDDKQMKDRTDKTYILENVRNIHIEVKRDEGFWNIMHNKMFIIPGIVFREGSANWSPSAEGASCYRGNCGPSENQDNNATYITDKREINIALHDFYRIWGRKSNIVIN
ncbi:phospholipase D-like domain-containing protein [Candidatus Acidulodesulfobacterium sp. H_13]|uniref:phospholipase D-like domain-containing protein n=1 Tax=Candidatus Acidulodesulfobacterium sp. H_13 TaxID=3395470 RepID=UPI003AF840B1